ncbi:MAG: HAD family hydrolase [Deltaproteobacteria bacterium]|nr:HAD family hydrolase [Deltaproteobacteria bacterium]
MNQVDLARLQGLLFDLGGTLDGDGEHWLNRFVLLYREHLPQVDFSSLKAAFYQAEEACLRDPRVASLDLPGLIAFHVSCQLKALGISSPQVQELLSRAFLASCRRYLKRNAAVLARLARRFSLGVITNFYGSAARILAEEGLGEFLSVVVDSATAGVRKPNPAIFQAALDKMALLPERVAYVGDSYRQDMVPAKQVGLVTIWLRNDAMSAPLPPDFDPAVADFEIHTLPDLEALLP